ncbi:MAG: isoamylase early set domain-containing protein [Spirochaetales bacterium]|nr:isoamylase early set domain-containing protein [Spirochaetales bacterium]
MNCQEWREQFKEWLTLHWLHNNNTRTDLPDELKNHAEICHSCSIRLKSARMLFMNTGPVITTPAGLSERITGYVLEKHREKRPRKTSWILVPLAAAAIILITFFFTLVFFTRPQNTITIHLMIQVPDATSVSVVGDWNGWNPAVNILSDSDGDGIWEIRLNLDKNNEYRYQFLINGKDWVPDPTSPLQVDDGFGGINSILEI